MTDQEPRETSAEAGGLDRGANHQATEHEPEGA